MSALHAGAKQMPVVNLVICCLVPKQGEENDLMEHYATQKLTRLQCRNTKRKHFRRKNDWQERHTQTKKRECSTLICICTSYPMNICITPHDVTNRLGSHSYGGYRLQRASAQTSSDYYVGTGVLAFKSHTRTTLSR